jgi:acyl-CoA reductase-like NAD-dependent aldehyde dehydrogenase
MTSLASMVQVDETERSASTDHQRSLASIAMTGPNAVECAIEKAIRGREISRHLSRARRADILSRTAAMVLQHAEELARAITMECGKTIRQARKEVARCANTLTLSAEEAKRFVGEIIPFDSYPGLEDRQGHYTREPLGIVLAITPFNDPLNLVAHKIGPAIASGNAVILKPAVETPTPALMLAQFLLDAGLPSDVLSVVTGGGDVGAELVAQPEVAMVSFTGGHVTGEAITRAAGLKRIAMDLGGNAPVIVLHDADLDRAVPDCVSGAFWAAGQNCIGVQRIFCHVTLFDQFCAEFLRQTAAMKVGDPLDPATDMGPMVSEAAAVRIEAWVNEAIAEGATCLIGNRRKGAIYAPTVLANVPVTSKVRCNEVFSPVVILEPWDNLDAVLKAANAPDFALHGAVFGRDIGLLRRVVDGLETGGVIVNDSSDFRFDGMPFGGAKRGAMGREGVRFAMEEMSRTKVVCSRI